MNLGEVKYRVKRQFGDEAGVQITDADIVRWVNDAQREIANQNDDVLRTQGTANVLADQGTYTFPPDLRLLMQIKYNGLHLRGLSFQDFNEYIDGLLNPINYSEGNPIVYYVWANQFTVFPTPSAQAALPNGFTIYYLRNPVDVAIDSDNLEFANGYHNHIVEYCLALAYELDENFSAATQKRTQFQQGVNQLKERDNWQTREAYPTISVKAEDQVCYFPGWF